MAIRGAPLLGVAAAMGLALGVSKISTRNKQIFIKKTKEIAKEIADSRPTARNLFWALERMLELLDKNKDLPLEKQQQEFKREAEKILKEDIKTNKILAQKGATLVPNQASILTHCNAGALATGGYGTALGVIRMAKEQGKKIQVFANETRPLLQGARLTAWELQKYDIPVTVIPDSAAGYLIKSKKIDLIIVGADRIARNGDVANKIGTYSVAVLAKENQVPFYVAAPFSTIDLNIPTGEKIKIEERNQSEVLSFTDMQIAPSGVPAWNPAFDITPNYLVTSIITEKGIKSPPYEQSLKY
jgi:methylthioribose-1-phosphate isomerase